jgi:putative hemolysin
MDKFLILSRPKGVIGIITLLALAVCITLPAGAMLNPASMYCSAMGYNLTFHELPAGTEGLCTLPDGTAVNEWDFLQGYDGQKYDYCTKQGLPSKRVTNRTKCNSIAVDICSVCILKNGREVEVTDLMNLSFAESRCGDGTCGGGENYKTCPQDCRSGGMDDYCDGVLDGKCDADCTLWKDPDCVIFNRYVITGVLIAVALLIIVIWYLRKKKQLKGT